MKKIITLISILTVSTTGLWGQATPNAGFENWTTCCFPSYTDPDNWDCANSQTAITGTFTVLKATGADVHSGTAAVKLITKTIFGNKAPGVVTTGTLPTSVSDPITGGIAYTLRPDSIVGWYKYTPQGADNGFAEFFLFGSAANNADTVAHAKFATPATTVSAYTRFSAALVYNSANAVANSIWLLSSSNNTATAVDNSVAFFDDLDLIFNPIPVSVDIPSQTNVSCYGMCNGSATANASGGTSPYTYAWSGGGTSSIKSSLCAGTYTVTVTDAVSSTSSASVTITQPAMALTAAATATPVLCYGTGTGSLTASASGGTSSYSYFWSGGLGTGANKSGVNAGTYTVTVYDANSCTTTASATVSQPASALTATASASPAPCYGTNTGSLTAFGSGGTSGYTYAWSGGLGSGQNISNAPAGTYTVTVTDANGCTTTASATVTQPATAVTAATTSTDANCGASDGTASATASGGTGTLTYLWSTTATTANITGLNAATYTVTVTDVNGCTATAFANVSNLGAPVASISSQTNVTGCYGDSTGSATVTASGGTGALTYTWSTTPVQSTTTATGLAAATYTVTVSDASGCKQIVSVTITEPQLLTAVTTPNDVSCNGGTNGSATVAATGGTSPYTYLWSNTQTTTTATGFAIGNYSVTITDAKGCNGSASVSISEPSALTTTFMSTPDSGSGNGTAMVMASGGTSPYTYQWSAGGQTSSTAAGLAAGNYSVTVTDTNSCTIISTTTVASWVGIKSAINNSKSGIIIYPNPAGKIFFVEADYAKKGNYEIKIISAIGQVLRRYTFYHTGGELRKELDLAVIRPGLVLVEVISEDVRFVHALMKVE